jgi:hypothetical protein
MGSRRLHPRCAVPEEDGGHIFHDKNEYGTQVDDIEKVIAVVFTLSTAYYLDQKPMFRTLCGSI